MKKIISFVLVIALLFCTFSLFSCVDETPEEAQVTAITLSHKNIVFRQFGETLQINAGVTPDNAVDKTLSWVSTNPGVATCEDGLVTARGYGVCMIKAIAKSGITSSCVVTVGATAPTLFLSSEVLKFSVLGSSEALVPSASSGMITAGDLTWISSNDSIATCTKGIVEAKGYGICSITAMSASGAKAVCTVVVEEENKPYLYISETEVKFSGIDQTANLVATVSNDAAMKISWFSSDENVATVNAGKITATGFGKCAIVAVAENGLSAYSIITVGEEKEIVAGHEEDILFEVKGVPCVSNYVNRQTGQVEGKLLILSYDIKIYDSTTSSDLTEDVLGVMVELTCVKIYDKDGVGGIAPVTLTVSTYRDEAGIFCDSKIYKRTEKDIAETIVVNIPVRIAKIEGQQRYFYITVSEYTIL